MLGDGDTKTIAKHNTAMPCGHGVVIKKEECVGHVVKCFYKRLEDMRCKRVHNEKGVVANMKGINALKATNQVTLCLYYKGAILSNTDSVDGMINDIQAIFHHSISTDENPQHSYCPKGEYSWCEQVAL